MTTIPFDTMEYFEKLKSAGFTEPQARVQGEAMQGVVVSYDETTRKELATKGDIQDVRNELKQDIQNLRNELKQDIQDVRNEMAETKHEILKWMATAMIAQTALLVGIIAFLK